MFRSLSFVAGLAAAPLAWSQNTIVYLDYTPQVFALCYEDQLDTAVTFIAPGPESIFLHICVGQMEVCCDQVFIYDGPDNTAPLLFAGNNNGDLSEILVITTGPALTCEIVTNDSINCWSEAYIPIVFSVGVGQAYPCDIGVPELGPFSFTMEPSVAGDRVRIVLKDALKGARVEVLDLAGRSLTQQIFTGPTMDLDVRDLADGEYIVLVTDGASRAMRRLIVAH